MKPLIRYGVKIDDDCLITNWGQPIMFKNKKYANWKKRDLVDRSKFPSSILKVVKLEIREAK